MTDEQNQDNILPEEPEPTTTENRGEDALRSMMQRNFIEYASYVIRDRAIPDVDDGLKPVQRRIMHTLHTMDDGRFQKVANTVGAAMKFHPHGDASIKDALVVLANKGYFIDRQGNFGNIITGDSAAAGRYIECRVAKFAKEVLFNPAITDYVDSYDGRSQEPVVLPSKVPSLLMLGSDGIAVGMATQIFPHNFTELLQAEISILKNEPFQVLPDFPTGGLMDASEYDDGRGSIRVRARIEADGDKKVVIREIPAYSTTESLIASIENAAKRGKLKISGITDLTAKDVCIEIALSRGIYAEETIRELYAYTDCQKTIKSMLLVICDNIPVEMTVSDILRRNVAKLRSYLERELQLKLEAELNTLQARTLERIFIEERLYKRIEKCTSLPKIHDAVRDGLEPFRSELHRDVSEEDITKLLAIPIRRISLFDLSKNQQEIDALKKEIEQTRYDLDHQVEFAIAFIQNLLDKYGDLYPRKTEITSVTSVDRKVIARRDIKVWHDKVNYFIGTAVKPSNKADAPLICTEFDRLMLLKTDGTCTITAITDKTYIGQTKYAFIYDKDRVFSIVYHEKKGGTWYAKRFQVGQFILDKEYHVVPEGCVIDCLYTNSGVVLSLDLPVNRRRSFNSVTVDFDSFPLRGREARGFKLTHYPVIDIKVVNKGTDGATPAPEATADGGEPENGGATATTAPENPTTPPPETGAGEDAQPTAVAADNNNNNAATAPEQSAAATPSEESPSSEAVTPENDAENAPKEPPKKPAASGGKLHQDDLPFFI